MAGLLSTSQSPDNQGAVVQESAATPVPDKAGAGVDDSGVSEEEQSQYNEFVTNGMRLMYDKEGLDGVLQSIQGGSNPVEGLANTVAAIVMRVEDSAVQQGTEISGDVLLQGGTELLEQAAELAEQAGMKEFSEQDLESALYLAMDLYRTTRQEQGKLPAEQFGQDLQELQAAEQDGSLEELIPGITDMAKRAPAPAAAPPGQPPAQPQRGLLG